MMSVLRDNPGLIQFDFSVPIGFPPEIDSKVDRDAINPSVERGVSAKS
jgi:hypothetical protein